MGKRKTGALRREQQNYHRQVQYLEQETETIDFNKTYKSKTKKIIELIPQSPNQEQYISALTDYTKDIIIASGPAGTGKTYLAMVAGIKALNERAVDKLVLTRPAIGADDEKHGFLPGGLNEKMEPWVKPMLDVLKEFYSVKEIEYMIKTQVIEFTPLAFCRGRNFKYSFVILDEAQNATPSQLKMLMTRIGTKSKIVITGDNDQADRKEKENGLLDLVRKLSKTNIPGIAFCKFENIDIRRHRIIEHILNLYQ